ncbi:hypothetical protein WCE10_10400 [Cronobacter muytjensii]|uniref:hypothetical protein n=1 Tax=Cronobacter muytjensii TaxID=413501 RepID=UPI0034D7A296
MNSSLTDFMFWPEDDVFFGAGVSVLCKKLEENHSHQTYSFLNLNGFSLQNFFSERPLRRRGRHVIISSEHLMPLAHYWMEKNTNVCAVFVSTTSFGTVYSTLKRLPAGAVLRPVRRNYPKISYKETVLLQHYLATGDTSYIQNHFSRSYSAVLAWKYNLACKLNVRKLEHLILQE